MFSSFPAQSLEDIEIAMKTLKAGDYSENPVDRHYHALKCEMKPMEKSSADFKVIIYCYSAFQKISLNVPVICFKINILCTSYIAQIKSDLKNVNKKMSMYLCKYTWMGWTFLWFVLKTKFTFHIVKVYKNKRLNYEYYDINFLPQIDWLNFYVLNVFN